MDKKTFEQLIQDGKVTVTGFYNSAGEFIGDEEKLNQYAAAYVTETGVVEIDDGEVVLTPEYKENHGPQHTYHLEWAAEGYDLDTNSSTTIRTNIILDEDGNTYEGPFTWKYETTLENLIVGGHYPYDEERFNADEWYDDYEAVSDYGEIVFKMINTYNEATTGTFTFIVKIGDQILTQELQINIVVPIVVEFEPITLTRNGSTTAVYCTISGLPEGYCTISLVSKNPDINVSLKGESESVTNGSNTLRLDCDCNDPTIENVDLTFDILDVAFQSIKSTTVTASLVPMFIVKVNGEIVQSNQEIELAAYDSVCYIPIEANMDAQVSGTDYDSDEIKSVSASNLTANVEAQWSAIMQDVATGSFVVYITPDNEATVFNVYIKTVNN